MQVDYLQDVIPVLQVCRRFEQLFYVCLPYPALRTSICPAVAFVFFALRNLPRLPPFFTLHGSPQS
jgi:hypothetical protein